MPKKPNKSNRIDDSVLGAASQETIEDKCTKEGEILETKHQRQAEITMRQLNERLDAERKLLISQLDEEHKLRITMEKKFLDIIQTEETRLETRLLSEKLLAEKELEAKQVEERELEQNRLSEKHAKEREALRVRLEEVEYEERLIETKLLKERLLEEKINMEQEMEERLLRDREEATEKLEMELQNIRNRDNERSRKRGASVGINTELYEENKENDVSPTRRTNKKRRVASNRIKCSDCGDIISERYSRYVCRKGCNGYTRCSTCQIESMTNFCTHCSEFLKCIDGSGYA